MFQRIVTLTLAAALTLVTVSAVQANEYKGKVVRLDPTHKVVVFDDGKMYRMAPDTVIMYEEKPVKWETIRPGYSVVIRSGEAVEFKDGGYVIIR